ncbi:MAG: DNA primase catalytic subunit PriS [Candidatus Micrarchaeota archaeon]|nr:DNA primase catalytic subunit PriS [Candidatus Micrarchaeota archaeon]
MAGEAMGKEEAHVRKLFSKYYSENKIAMPSAHMREFGFGGWDKKIEFRHIAVPGEAELMAKLALEAPLYVSYSVAYYQFPSARPMVRKGWRGADLVFDLDAPEHSCGKFTCQECLDKVKQDAIKLIEDFLLPDFGFSKSELSANFSGGRGYHVHVKSQAVEQLDRSARREIADYIAGTGLDFDRLFWEDGKKLFGPKPSDGGYGGKFAREYLRRLDDEEFAQQISRKLSKPEEKARLKSAIQQGNWDNIGIANRKRKLREKFEEMRLTLAGRIDANVTADITKLIRMPNSLHGGSGLCAKSIPSLKLDGFEPMRDAQAFRQGSLKIKAAESIPEVPGIVPEKMPAGKIAEVPQAQAAYLLCKKAAVLAD